MALGVHFSARGAGVMRPMTAAALLLALVVGALTHVSPVGAAPVTTTFSNPASIAIPATGDVGIASPYPSNITVAGLCGTITKVTVTLNGLTHTSPEDNSYLLVSPAGAKMIILADSGLTYPVTNLTVTLDDAAATGPADDSQLSSGTYKPADYKDLAAPDAWPLPAPAGPYADPAPTGSDTFASAFNGTAPNGTWSLYIVDKYELDTGQLAGGWSLALTIGACQAPTQLSQVRGNASYGDATGSVTARLTEQGGPAIANATVAFTLDGTPVGSATTNAQGVATLTGVAMPAGLNAGTYPNRVCASYAGDANHLPTGPTCGPLVIGRSILWVKPVDRNVGLKQPNPPTDPHLDAANCPAPSYCLELARGSTFAPGQSWSALNLSVLRFQYARNPPSTNATEKVGKTYRITAFGVTSSNYDIRYDPGTMTVVAAP